MGSHIRKSLLSSPIFDSRIKSANVQKSERLLGFLLGPSGVILLNAIIVSYLNVFYTDVIKIGYLWGGLFLIVFPIISSVIKTITNVIMGQIIERTSSRQGKARPWLLVAAPCVAVSAILLFLIPEGNDTIKVIWIMFSYNLYISFAYTMYQMSHNMLVPLSTRNIKQRDGVAVLSNLALNIVPGMFVALLFPMLILPAIGVDKGKWLTVISIFAIIVLPATLIEYYFTKERITEETAASRQQKNSRSTLVQLKACLSSPYWVIFMVAFIITQVCTNLQNTGLIYYSNWVLGTYNDGVTQVIVAAVGNLPLGLGVIIMWPLVKKFGKRNTLLAGLIVMAIGGAIFFVNPTNMGTVLPALIIRSFGLLPLTYLLMAMLADAMDHVEWKTGFRCDGITMSIYTIIFTVSAGIAIGLFNLGLSLFDYKPPAADGSWVPQSTAVQNYFSFSYIGALTVCTVVLFVLFWFFKVEKIMPQIQAEITERHKAEAEAEGREWISPEEKARLEQVELDRMAEEKRIQELKVRCAKKNLNFDEEEAKYQAKLVEKNQKKTRHKKN